MKKKQNYILFQKKLLLRMKLTILILCLCIVQVSASTTSVGQNLSLQVKDKTIKEVFKIIENQSNFRFFFNDAYTDLDKVVNLKSDNKSISYVLNELLANSKVSYRVLENNLVVIAPVAELQQIKITGKVTDATTGDPLPGVSILVEGTTTLGTVTDVNGTYNIEAPNANTVLVFSFIGYLTEHRAVGSSTTIDVTMASDIKSLDEVVVVGYGTVRKGDVTTSIGAVSSQDIMKTPITTLEQALQGNVSGVTVITTSGDPGADVSIRIRGGSSIKGDNQPLLVVDGFTTDGNLNSINPSDIKDIQVLKDASATAIYGSRGGNGVIMITTKSGQVGKPRVSYQGYYGWQKLRKKLDVLNAVDKAILYNDAKRAVGSSPSYWDLDTLNQNAIDWQDALFSVAPQQSHTLILSGGDQKTKYYISGNYLNQDGIIANSNFQRVALRSRVDMNLRSNLQVGANLNISQNIQKIVGKGENGAVKSAMVASPTQSYQLDPSGGFYVDANGDVVTVSPIATAFMTYNRVIKQNFQGNAYLDWTIVKGLSFRSSFDISIGNEQDYYYFPNVLAGGKVSQANSQSKQRQKWLNDNVLTFAHSFGKHKITLMAGQSAEKSFTNSFKASGSDYNTDAFLMYNLGAANVPSISSQAADAGSLLSLFGRAMYNYDEKYLLSLSYRADGSSKFGKDNRWGYFPSGSFAWRVSNEPFMKNLDIIHDWKIRLGYGLTGSDRISAYSSQSLYDTYYSAIGGTQSAGYGIGSLGNPLLQWETTEQYDAGTDISLVKGRVSMTFDYYKKNTRDLLLDFSVPSSSGYSTVSKNVGSVENKGWEFSISSQNLIGKFQWTTTFNFGINRNKITSLGGNDNIPMIYNPNSSWKSGYAVLMKVGEPLGSFWGYKTNGVFADWNDVNSTPAKLEGTNTKPGFVKYVDLNRDSVINDDDKVILGHPDPDWQAGITNTFSYKGFDLSIFFIGQYGNTILNVNKGTFIQLDGGNNQLADVVDRWRLPNPLTGDPGNQSTGVPYPVAGSNITPVVSDRYVEDGSYLRLKTLTLGYTLPKNIVNHIKISNIRVYVTGTNLLTFTKYTGFDPEISTNGSVNIGAGLDDGGYPTAKTVIFGLNIDF